MKRRLIWIWALLGCIYLQGNAIMAQCSQCKAAADQSRDSSYSFESINSAVLYLLAMPVLFPFIIGGIWYVKKRQKQKAEAST